MSNLKGLNKAQQMFDGDKKIAAIKYLRQENPSLDLVDARCAVDSEYAAKIADRTTMAFMLSIFDGVLSTLLQSKTFILHVKEHGYDMYAQALAQNLLEKIRVDLNDLAAIKMGRENG